MTDGRVWVVGDAATATRARVRLEGGRAPMHALLFEDVETAVAAREVPPVAVVFDLDGPNALADVRTLLTRIGRPVVVLASSTQVPLGLRALHQGARDLVLKDNDSFDLLPHVVRHAVERTALHEEMLQNARLATLGRLSAGVLHELGNATMSLLLNLDDLDHVVDDLGLSDATALATLKELVADCTLSGQTTKSLLEDLRQVTLGDATTAEHERLDLRDVVSSVVRMLRQQLQRHALIVELPAEPVEVLGRPRHLRQVVVNLLLNGIDAIEGASPRRSGSLSVHLERRGRRVELRISDDGPGIPEPIRRKLFQPFNTSKQHGTGLGLSVVRELVEAHHGRIQCDSKPGATTFVIHLPDADEASADGISPRTPSSHPPGRRPSSETSSASFRRWSPPICRFSSASHDVDELVREMRETFPEAPAAVVCFASPRLDLTRFGRSLREAFPHATVVGSTTAGQIGDLGFQPDGVAAVALGHAFETEAFPLDLSRVNDSVEEVAIEVRRRIASMPTDHGAFGVLLVDGLSEVEERLAAALYEGVGSLPLVGGSAGDELAFRSTQVLHDGSFAPGRAVLLLVQTALPFTVVRVMHHVPTARRMVITAADPERRLVLEIDGRPAAEAYAEYVGVSLDALSPQVFSKHPLMLRLGDQTYLRSIQQVECDGSIRFYCTLGRGSVVSLASPARVMESLTEAFSKARAEIGEPAVVLGFDCVLRRLELEQLGLADEVGHFLAAQNVVGFSTYGEQIDGMHVNQTFTGVAIGGPR